jgi:hypothetical protein
VPGNRTRHTDVGSPFWTFPRNFVEQKCAPDRVRLEKVSSRLRSPAPTGSADHRGPRNREGSTS